MLALGETISRHRRRLSDRFPHCPARQELGRRYWAVTYAPPQHQA
jgi:hypothetical protein